ncbi:hypothetical protein C361_02328 [Cryptococcus neoformans Tu259-1]|uniref:Uncharacterized protein n=1 Tax=Cryptococcus neoformans Tu259-1 TaxID=1230072 RepID=A0A854QFV2_CRYNE|nr:hypothetical protein C361_02328 [Cryptococcus neoformans var. grubii Tu259-1]
MRQDSAPRLVEQEA